MAEVITGIFLSLDRGGNTGSSIFGEKNATLVQVRDKKDKDELRQAELDYLESLEGDVFIFDALLLSSQEIHTYFCLGNQVKFEPFADRVIATMWAGLVNQHLRELNLI